MGEPDEGRLEDVDRDDELPRRSSGLTLLGLLGGAVLVAMLFGQLTAPDPQPRPPTAGASTTATDHPTGPAPDKPIGVESLRRCLVPLGALALGDHLRLPGWAIEHWDCDALTLGPWSVIIRDADGHFASKSAVVIYPFPGQPGPLDTPVAKPQGGKWNTESRSLVWPINEGYNAKIVGDLGLTRLSDLATRITVQQGRPHFSPADGFAATPATSYRPPAVHELSYQTADLGEAGRLGTGVIWTAVMSGAGAEAQAFEDGARPAGLVRGKPAIFTTNPYLLSVMSAHPELPRESSGALVWESARDEVTCIGYDGSATGKEAIEVLRALADKGTVLSPAQWLSRDRNPVG